MRGPKGDVGMPGPMGPPGNPVFCKDDPDYNAHIKEYEREIAYLHRSIDTLTTALNESRDQIQALLDYCFTDRSGWLEGSKEKEKEKEKEKRLP